MKLFINRTLITMTSLLTLLVAVAALPTTAHASDIIHFDSSIVNVGFTGKHRGSFNRGYRSSNRGYRSSNRFFNNGFRSSRRSLNRGYRNFNNNYNRGYRSSNRGFSNFDRGFSRNLNRTYRGSSNYYSRGNNYRRSYSDNYYCPIVGFSQYRNEGQSCYQHNGHFHCE